MAESSYEEHGTSDEFVDPFCDTCYEGKGLNVKVYGYCKECFQFICSDCHLLHSKFPLARGHTVLRGSSMPQSQADKPAKFDYCDSHPKLLKNDFSFKSGKAVQDFLFPSATFGSVSKSETKYDKDIVVKDVVFPFSQYKPPKAVMVPPQQTSSSGRSTGPSVPLSKIAVTKKYTHKIKLKDDREPCFVTGLAVTKDRKRIVVDHSNKTVKLFSPDMMFLSSVSVPDKPRDIAMISDKEAVVTADNNSLVILDISGSQLSIKTTTPLSYDVRGISRYNDKLVVTSPGSNPPSAKLIDQTGRVYWSVSSDQQTQALFSKPWYVSSAGDGRASTVIVTDWGKGTLTLLKGDTGEVITRRQLKEIYKKYPRGVTSDSGGNVYVCYSGTSQVAVLSGDLSKEMILLSRIDCPNAIVYDAHQLIISSSNLTHSNNVYVYQLS